MGFFDYFNKNKKEDLEKGLEPTKNSFFSKITKAVAGKSKIDIESLDDIEEALIMSDVSLDTTIKIINRLEARIEKEKYIYENELYQVLKHEIEELLNENKTEDIDSIIPKSSAKPYVIMVVGVNGVAVRLIHVDVVRLRTQGRYHGIKRAS